MDTLSVLEDIVKRGLATPPDLLTMLNWRPDDFLGLAWRMSSDDRTFLLDHLGRSAFHCSKDRDFKSSYVRTFCEDCRSQSIRNAKGAAKFAKQKGCQDSTCGKSRPKFYKREFLGKHQYIQLTHRSRAAVIVADIDEPGTPGGNLANLAPRVYQALEKMAELGCAPNFIGVNPVSGKAQAIWMLEKPAYRGKDQTSPSMKLLAAVQSAFNEFFGGDPHFSHRFSRNPFYTGDDPQAYVWWTTTNAKFDLKGLARIIGALGGPQLETVKPKDEKTPQRHSSGRELIEHAQANVERSREIAALMESMVQEKLFSARDIEQLEANDPNIFDGVKMYWSKPGVPARDKTAFRHALRVAWRVKNDQSGQHLTDDFIIDCYLHGYAQAQGQDTIGRPPEIPPLRDLKTMARRVRGYVGQDYHRRKKTGTGGAIDRLTGPERKALATLGRRGGQKAAQRHHTDPDGAYSQGRRAALAQANQQRVLQGQKTRGKVFAAYTAIKAETGKSPSAAQIGRELGITRKTAAEHLRVLKASGLTE